jgi:hypothetical protein
MLINAFDPGGTTGIASYYLLDEGRYTTSGGSFDYYEMFNGRQLGPEPHFKELWSYLAMMSPDVIVCEDFLYQVRDNTPTINLISRDYIGVLRLYCELTRKPLKMQNPNQVKETKWVSDEALKKLNVYQEGCPHQNDATRHLIFFVVNTLKRKEILYGLRGKRSVG